MDPVALAAFDRLETLPGGQRMRLRPIRPDDARRLEELYARLSRHSAYQRFFTVMQRLAPDWARFLAAVDHQRRFAVVAEEIAPPPAIVGVARYEPLPEPEMVEIAVVVQDSWQGQGLGSVLLRDLLRAAELNGIHRFRAYVLAENRRMLHVLTRQTEVEERRLDGGVIELTLTRKV